MMQMLETLFCNLAVATLLAAAVGILALKLRRPALLHVLWILVLVKLITPPVLRVGVLPPAGDLTTVRAAHGESAVRPSPPLASPETPAAVLPAGPSSASGPGPAAPRLLSGDAAEPGSPPTGASVAIATLALVRSRWPLGLLAIWAAGSVLVLGIAVTRCFRFRRLLSRAEPAPASLRARAARLATRLGLPRTPRVSLVPARVSPMLWALAGRPHLLLPIPLVDRLSADETESLLAHELAHLRRRDHWVRWLELAVTVAFWWFPLVWLVRAALRTAEEQCCDAWVVWSLPGRAEAYARALLQTVEFLACARPAMPPVASGARHVRQLERRLTMILDKSPPRMLGVAGRLAAVVAAVLMLSFLPTWAQESRENEIREVKLKLHRVEKAIAELEAAGLPGEVEHLRRVADKLRVRLDRIRGVNEGEARPQAEPAGPARRHSPAGELERQLVELKEHARRLEKEGRHDEAKEVYRKLQGLAQFVAQEKLDREFEKREFKLKQMSRDLDELRQKRRAIAESHPDQAELLERKIAAGEEHLERARVELEAHVDAMHDMFRQYQEEEERAAAARGMRRRDLEPERLRDAEMRARAEAARREFEEAMRIRPPRDARPDARLEEQLRRQAEELERHREVIHELKHALAETHHRHDMLMKQLEELKRMLHEQRGEPPAGPRDKREPAPARRRI